MESKDTAAYEEARRLIRKAMAEHKLVLFVGSGTSLDAGMPSWSSAVSQIAQKLRIQVNDADMLKIPQYYFNLYGQHNYTMLMRNIFKYGVPLHPGRVHELILRFDADTIVTTNYDHLLEEEAEDSGKILHVVAEDSELPYKKGNELIKMHGDFEHGNFVLKENDYLNYTKNFKLINNYITSLAGTNLILFIGYSFSDPDVKQILTWLKNAVGNNLPQAYMISVSPFEKVIDDYFKKFGINVIYAEDISAARGKINPSKTEALEDTLLWILEDNNRTFLEELYQKLGPYRFLDVPYVTDVIDTLSYFGLHAAETHSSEMQCEKSIAAGENKLSENPKIQHEKDKSKETSILHLIEEKPTYYLPNPFFNGRSNIVPADIFDQKGGFLASLPLFLKMCYVADRQAGNYPDANLIRKQTWYQLIDEAYRENRLVANDKLYTMSKEEYKEVVDILNVMMKSGFVELSIKLLDENKRQINKKIDSKDPARCVIPLNGNSTNDQMEVAINCFDYKKLEEMEKEDENWISRSNPDTLLKQAHVCHFLGNYLRAYNLAKIAASQYYRRPNYAKYFIAKCDQYYLGRALIENWIINDKVERDIIRTEVKEIDLDRIFAGLPNLSGNLGGLGAENQFLKDLYSFKLAYKTFQKTVEKANKTNEEAESKYFIHAGEPEYIRLRNLIASFYFYQQGNHFLVDDYSEVQEIYKVAFFSLLSSVSVKDRRNKGDDIAPNHVDSSNIHEKELQPFDLLLGIRFASPKDITEHIKGASIIRVSKDGLKYLELLVENLNDAPEKVSSRREYFRNALTLCGYITLSSKLVKLILSMLINRILQRRQRVLTQSYSLMIKFLDNLYRQICLSDSRQIISSLYEFIETLVMLLQKGIFPVHLRNIADLCDSACYIFKKCNIEFDHVEIVNRIFSGTADMNAKAELALHLYAFGSTRIKQAVKEYLSEWAPDKDKKGCLLYVLGIKSGAYSNMPEMEENCFSILEKYQPEFEEHIKNKHHYSVDNYYTNLIYDLVELVIIGRLSYKERLKDICRSYGAEAACWLLDIHDEESFAKFEPQWLELCGSQLLEQISADDSIKKKINERMKKAYETGDLDDGLVKLYFEYFS